MTDLTPARLEELLARATPGPWHHCQAFLAAQAQRTIHGPVPSVRVDYVSTWPHAGGTPKGHRVVIPMEGREANVRSEDMALAALSPALAARVIELEARMARLQALTAEQAEDEGLWFIARTAPEGYLQQELRRLHAAVENWPPADGGE